MRTTLKSLPVSRRVWSFTYPKLAATVAKVAKDLGFDLGVYQARRSGASADMASRRRTLAEVKQRGGWEGDRPVVRYERRSLAST
eukprot:4161619-Pyramimonas_sp.AAC.1